MNELGYIRVASVSPIVRPADVESNLATIIEMAQKAVSEGVKITVFPELSITGYTCADLFFQNSLLRAAEGALIDLKNFTEEKQTTIIVGLPLRLLNRMYNCAAVISYGKILGIVPKTHIPNYNEFYESRWFSDGISTASDSIRIDGVDIPFGSDILFEVENVLFGVELCEDLWVPIPPSSEMAIAGADIIFNLSATNELVGKNSYLLDLIKQQSARCRSGYVYSSAGWGESSTDLAFAGNCIIAECGNILADSPRFVHDSKIEVCDIDIEIIRNSRLKASTFNDQISRIKSFRIVKDEKVSASQIEAKDEGESIIRKISSHPFFSDDKDRYNEQCYEIFSIQTWGLAQRMNAINFKKCVIGISGGLDSTLALLVAVNAFDKLGIDRKGIIAVTMPGFGTSDRTYHNAVDLIKSLGVTFKEISIANAVNQHFVDIDQDPILHDACYENSQARERTQILMDLANKENGLVIGTGDLSELALGWCTYNGDHMSMYGVNASVPKTMVKRVVENYAENCSDDKVKALLLDIVDTPISPELLPTDSDGNIDQVTEDLVGPYELHDFFLDGVLRNSFSPKKIYWLAIKAFEGKYDSSTIKHWLQNFYRRFFSQQFKRSCMPDGVKVGSVSLSPRGDWRMPSDAKVNLWINEVNRL